MLLALNKSILRSTGFLPSLSQEAAVASLLLLLDCSFDPTQSPDP